MIEIINGDLLSANAQYIAHACNCVTRTSAFFAKDLFNKYPYADIYSGRFSADKPGNIIIKGNGEDERFIIGLLSQFYPGKPNFPDSTLDGIRIREKYFYHCLLRIAKIENLNSIAFNWRIGCGAAGGNWEHYLGMLTNFAQYVKSTQNTKVFIYKREFDE
tara:strand:+ start:12875 stop:13357 length:483 start_codon:yes stop_codon:yes gene_type:complete